MKVTTYLTHRNRCKRIEDGQLSKSNSADCEFAEWIKLFSEGPFVILRAYADESETEATTISGFVSTTEYWVIFSKKWQKILDDFLRSIFSFSGICF